MKTLYIISAVLAVVAVIMFFVQKKKHSEALTILTAAIIGAAVGALLISLCVDAMFVRPLFD